MDTNLLKTPNDRIDFGKDQSIDRTELAKALVAGTQVTTNRVACGFSTVEYDGEPWGLKANIAAINLSENGNDLLIVVRKTALNDWHVTEATEVVTLSSLSYDPQTNCLTDGRWAIRVAPQTDEINPPVDTARVERITAALRKVCEDHGIDADKRLAANHRAVLRALRGMNAFSPRDNDKILAQRDEILNQFYADHPELAKAPRLKESKDVADLRASLAESGLDAETIAKIIASYTSKTTERKEAAKAKRAERKAQVAAAANAIDITEQPDDGQDDDNPDELDELFDFDEAN